ncbi:MAG: sigma-54 dependent transcriptional regulator [Ignavibacteriaceae bacterium]|nr:sigma-54 dependent transcriptional regulator [Ignavibacteriaceae bacterium]
MNLKVRILVLDDEEDMLRGFGKLLEAQGHNPIMISNAAGAAKMLAEEDIDIVFTDLQMPDIDGIQMLELVQKFNPSIPVIIFSAYGTVDRAVNAMKAGAFDFIEKPFDAERVSVVIQKALNHLSLYKERNNLLWQLEEKFHFDNIIGISPEIRKIFAMVENVSKSEANILLTGESGTGKELVARSIHVHSGRKMHPFVPVNCGAFPENLFEAEIFGYEKGAFTGANKRKIGLLEYADGGTFFMDEVCELPMPLQTKLLRAIQDKQIRRIGGNELIQVSVRIISATNESIEKAMSQKKLREDLYYRLNVINIHLPPLRERKEDIRILAESFLKKYSLSMHKGISGFSEEVIRLFEAYNWPGNVRELENIVERAVTLSKGTIITEAELPNQLFTPASTGSLNEIKFNEAKQIAINDVEKNYLLHLLEKHKGNITRMAEDAGMTRRNMHRLLNNHNIDSDQWRH